MLDINKIRNDFPILSEKIRGKQLVYLDNGASTQKPKSVIDAESFYYDLNTHLSSNLPIVDTLTSVDFRSNELLLVRNCKP